MKHLAIFLILLVILISGCTTSGDTESFKKAAIDACIKICNSIKDKQDLSNGPCIGDPIPEHPGWVCDVAHWPREPVDNLPENQCEAYRNGTATHFVEVTPECTLIRAV